MTLGHVYDLDLKRNETQVKEVIIQAQGEMALEEYVKQVKETWTSYALDLVNYQNKCRLIRCVYSKVSNYILLHKGSLEDGMICSTSVGRI